MVGNYILNNNDGIPIPGGREFIGQCITYLLGTDLITFTIVCISIIVVLSLIKMIIKVKEN